MKLHTRFNRGGKGSNKIERLHCPGVFNSSRRENFIVLAHSNFGTLSLRDRYGSSWVNQRRLNRISPFASPFTLRSFHTQTVLFKSKHNNANNSKNPQPENTNDNNVNKIEHANSKTDKQTEKEETTSNEPKHYFEQILESVSQIKDIQVHLNYSEGIFSSKKLKDTTVYQRNSIEAQLKTALQNSFISLPDAHHFVSLILLPIIAHFNDISLLSKLLALVQPNQTVLSSIIHQLYFEFDFPLPVICDVISTTASDWTVEEFSGVLIAFVHSYFAYFPSIPTLFLKPSVDLFSLPSPSLSSFLPRSLHQSNTLNEPQNRSTDQTSNVTVQSNNDVIEHRATKYEIDSFTWGKVIAKALPSNSSATFLRDCILKLTLNGPLFSEITLEQLLVLQTLRFGCPPPNAIPFTVCFSILLK